MKVEQTDFYINQLHYCIRSANNEDAQELSEVRVQIDGETENMDREQGEGYIDEQGFKRIIAEDLQAEKNLFLVAETNGKIIGFSRCEGNKLKRSLHKIEFGICVLREYWGFGIGRNLLQQSIQWADSNGIIKMELNVIETHEKAISLYEKNGFEVEGVLKKDKRLSDGNFYNTIVMGRLNQNN